MIPQLSPEFIAKATRQDKSLVDAVLRGISKGELEGLLTDQLTIQYGPSIHPSMIETARMNFIGTLRSLGYEVTGGRKGRSLPYQIVGWEEKAPPTTWADWPVLSKLVVQRTQALSPMSDHAGLIQALLGQRQEPWHENCWLYLSCYEGAKDKGYWDPRGFVVLQKFESAPRFRIFNVNAPSYALIEAAEYLATGSARKVSIVNVPPDVAMQLKALHKAGSIEKRVQAIYDTQKIAEHPEDFLHGSSLKTLRQRDKHLRAERFSVVISDYEDDIKEIIAQWRLVNEPKMRQLAVGRDFKAISQWSIGKLVQIGYNIRTHPIAPVCVQILDRIPGNAVADIVEKSLNYSSQVGGKSGVADWNLWSTCVWLSSIGIEWFNAGGFEGGGMGLSPHKRKYCPVGQEVSSLTFQTAFPPLRGFTADSAPRT